MSIVMASPAPQSGWWKRLLNPFGRGPSNELARVDAAVQRLENAAMKIEEAVSGLDAIGELVDGLRTGPHERQAKRRKRKKVSKRAS